ncbi:hypothetical protein CS542_07885 [Pedobacter sp. IW39]|nr:hypothetical protein CS542_07885 [Pedobacter sp. IW39]
MLRNASSPLQISGSADVYYKYDFKSRILGRALQMIRIQCSSECFDLACKKTQESFFCRELSFGPRGQYGSTLGEGEVGMLTPFHIQNLYMSYALTNKLRLLPVI